MATLREIHNDYSALGGKLVNVHGWIRTIRDSKNFAFVELNDGTFFKNTQIIIDASLPNYNDIVKLNVGAGISLEGTLVLTPEMKQPYEIHATSVNVEATSTPTYPLQKKRHSMEFLREIAHLRPRTNTFLAVFKVRSVAAQAIHSFFAERGFVYVNTPRYFFSSNV